MFTPFIRYKLKRQAKNDQRRPILVHGNLLNSVAVVARKECAQFEFIAGYVKELRKRGVKTVDFYIEFPNQKIQDFYSASLKDFPFNPKSFTWMGGYKSPELEHSLSRDYDVLIDLSEGRSIACDLLISRIQAKWKAGRRFPDRDMLLDFMLEVHDDDMRNLIHHLNNYLTSFNNLNAA
jgi:hypothetical protein